MTNNLNPHPGNQIRQLVLMAILCVTVSAVVVLPFFWIGEEKGKGCCGGVMPATHDMVMHLNQMQGFYSGLASGRIYPIWHDNTNNGFGAPITLYYPPPIYYLTSALFFLTGDWITVLKALYLLTMVGSGLAFYFLARRFISYGNSLLAMCVYIAMPYHLLNHYQRAALAECLSFTFIPLVLLCFVDLLRIRVRDETVNYPKLIAALAVIWGVFIWSHPPTAFQFAMICGPVLVVTGLVKREWKGLASIAGAMLLGVALSGTYLVPAALEQKYVQSADVERAWPYHESYILKTDSQRYDHRGDGFVLSLDRMWLAGFIGLLAIGLVLEVASRRGERAKTPLGWTFRIWFTIALLASLMMLPASRAIGYLIPGIKIGVFAWRMLTITSLAGALLSGYLADTFVRAGMTADRLSRALSGIVFALYLGSVVGVSFGNVVYPMYRVEAFVADPGAVTFPLLPVGASRDVPPSPEVTAADGDVHFTVEEWKPEYRRVRLELPRNETVSFRSFNFPGWTAHINGKPAEIKTGRLGEITLSLDAGAQEVVLDLERTGIRLVGLYVSAAAAIFIAALFFRGWRTRRFSIAG